MQKWRVRWWTIHGVGVGSTVPKQPKHLRRHNSQHKQNWVRLGCKKCMVGKPMRKLWWWWLMKKKPSLSSLDTLGDSNHSSRNHICDGEQNWLGCGSLRWCSRRCGGSPRQRCQRSKNLRKSNGVGSIFMGWGMSIASKQAKERQNRSSDELLMDKTKIS